MSSESRGTKPRARSKPIIVLPTVNMPRESGRPSI